MPSTPRLPERTIILPEGCVLSNEEVAQLLTEADERKRRNEAWIVVVPGQEGYTVFVPSTASLLPDEACRVLSRANEAKEHGYAELVMVWHQGQITSNRVNIKGGGEPSRGIRVGVAPPRRDF